MPGRIKKHPPLRRGGLLHCDPGAYCYGSGNGWLQVFYGYVQVHLLVLGTFGPRRLDVVCGTHQREHRASPGQGDDTAVWGGKRFLKPQ